MPTTMFRSTFIALMFAALGATACGNDEPIGAIKTASTVYTIALAHGKPVVIAEQALTVELIAVKDSRCPIEVRCFWAGHAAVTLKVGKADMATEILTIGSPAPSDMKLPFDASYGRYKLHLLQLEPANSTAKPALPLYRATVTVSML